jgi:pimeloyl-ACP methyl ester carboxylesterase
MAADDSLSRRDLGTLLAGVLAASPHKLAAQSRFAEPAATTGPALDIAEWSYKFYGVEHALLARGTVCNGMQMYVEHWIPTDVRHPYPVVLVHGGYGQGSDWISTPDGHRGWATLLLEQGYKVYVVDRPGQGRNPYYPFLHGLFDQRAQTFEDAARAIGGSVGDAAVAQFVASRGQPMGNNVLSQSVWRTRGAMLLEEIGPSIFVTQGDGAIFAGVVAQERPQLVKAIATVEANAPLRDVKVPLLSVGPERFGPMQTLGRNNREALQPVLDWLDTNAGGAVATGGLDANRNIESTALKLADQGCFWTGCSESRCLTARFRSARCSCST